MEADSLPRREEDPISLYLPDFYIHVHPDCGCRDFQESDVGYNPLIVGNLGSFGGQALLLSVAGFTFFIFEFCQLCHMSDAFFTNHTLLLNKLSLV